MRSSDDLIYRYQGTQRHKIAQKRDPEKNEGSAVRGGCTGVPSKPARQLSFNAIPIIYCSANGNIYLSNAFAINYLFKVLLDSADD